MINLGIIGLGGIAGCHVKWAKESGRFYVKAAADIIEDNNRAKELSIPQYYTDYKKMLTDPSIDAVLIASPHYLHKEHCIAALEAKKHILIEKPISRNLSEAKSIIEAADKAKTTSMIGFCQRFYEKHAYIKSLLDENKLGRIMSARIDHYQNFNPPQSSWWRNKEMVGGGAVIGSGVHRLDILRWYFGEPVSVYAKAVNCPKRLEAEACVHSVIEFESGVIADFSINWATYKFLYEEGLSISGENGIVVVNSENKIGMSHIENGKLLDFNPPKCQTMYEHFADCIENNKEPLTSLEEGYKTLRLVRAIYKSTETGMPVNPKTIEF